MFNRRCDETAKGHTSVSREKSDRDPQARPTRLKTLSFGS
jgi:hypothetical protein